MDKTPIASQDSLRHGYVIKFHGPFQCGPGASIADCIRGAREYVNGGEGGIDWTIHCSCQWQNRTNLERLLSPFRSVEFVEAPESQSST